MTGTIWPNTQKLSEQLQTYRKQKHTGCLQIWAGGTQEWSLFFCLGRLVWATGGIHPNRRWLRLMSQHCPQISLDREDLQRIDRADCGDYDYLQELVRQQRITGQQAARIVRDNALEVFFDILQQESFGPISFHSYEGRSLDASLTLMQATDVLGQAYPTWMRWRDTGLARLSPDMAPVIRDAQGLKEALSPSAHQKLAQIADGNHTLRDIATLCQQDILLLTRTLRVYIRRQLLELVSIPDVTVTDRTSIGLKHFGWLGSKITPLPQGDELAGPLVAHVDDNQHISQQMKDIIEAAGCRFLGIQDSVMALPVLLEQQPSLIFLDLMMPVVNGFELCAQLRKTSLLKDTPVIILTSNEGLFDRVRARVVGCTTYITKPIQQERVMLMLDRYLNLQISR